MKMRGIILAGGTGSRLYPLTKVVNKCLLPVGREPMVYRMIDIFVGAGITDIMLITGPEHMGQTVSLLGSGSDRGCSMAYRVQDKADGIASALRLAKDFVGGGKFAVLLGDNIFGDHGKITEALRSFESSTDDFRLFAKEVPDPQRFGVPVFDENGKVVNIVEKPKDPPCNKAIVGLYGYTSEAFDVVDTLQPSARGEYEISDVNAWFVKNRQGEIVTLDCDWIDAGTHDSYRRANEIVWANQ